MDKLVEHGIRMLEIVEGENDFFRNDAKRQADIARAVYDTILRVQVLERKADRKTEPKTYVINPQEPTNDDKCFECDDFFTCGGQCNKIEDEPQTSGTPYKIDTSSVCKTKPQIDGYMTAKQTEDYRKMLDKADHKVYGNIEDEPQTERSE